MARLTTLWCTVALFSVAALADSQVQIGVKVRHPTPLRRGCMFVQYRPSTCEVKASSGDTVSVHYTGSLLDGSEFDSSHNRGVPLDFKLGAGQVIQGWEVGVVGACLGEKRKLKIPPEMGYGETGAPPRIPVGAGVCGLLYVGIAQTVLRAPSYDTIAQETPLDVTITPAMTGLYALGLVEDIDGVQRDLAEFAQNVSLVVNVASFCGYTDSNYRGLERLYKKYREHGFTVLAFPCNQFGRQEPQECPQIKAFVQQRYNVTFPMFAKIEVNGPGVHPVYAFLKARLPDAEQRGVNFDLRWNFQKFLIGRDGVPVALFPADFENLHLEAAIEAIL